ncbi:hypothetical protein KP22_12160 [Pectobacterium betavasculorum]|uniref:Uncharacterized protein n=1 Tax=Pectobacterium betavasculorum TaxID=55207 RepID=A0A093UB36_9GAMM|nr:hypothetical protein [Pectobacterium betavasculorum]KFX05448.1 hypothetical protein KP22_12160 [Pectobacterium betavasculorum]
MNVGRNGIYRLKPDFFELVAIAELISYESLSFLPFTSILLNNDIALAEKESVDLLYQGTTLTLALDTKIHHKQSDILCLFTPDPIYVPDNNRKIIVIRRCPYSKKNFYNKRHKEWCFSLSGQCYNSKISLHGDWKAGAYENLDLIMNRFLSTRNNA